jgi:hypothetical protein
VHISTDYDDGKCNDQQQQKTFIFFFEFEGRGKKSKREKEMIESGRVSSTGIKKHKVFQVNFLNVDVVSVEQKTSRVSG